MKNFLVSLLFLVMGSAQAGPATSEKSCASAGDVYATIAAFPKVDPQDLDLQVFTAKPDEIAAVGVVTQIPEATRGKIAAIHILMHRQTQQWMLIPVTKGGCLLRIDGSEGTIDSFLQMGGRGIDGLIQIFHAAERYLAEQRKSRI